MAVRILDWMDQPAVAIPMGL